MRALIVFLMIVLVCFDNPKDLNAQDLSVQSCEVIAKIYDHNICRRDIEQSQSSLENMKAEYSDNGLDPDQAIRARQYERLGNLIWDAALEHKFGAPALKPQLEDIQSYKSAFQARLNQNYQDDMQTLQDIETLLQTQSLTPEQQDSVRSLLQTTRTSVRFYEQRLAQRQDMSPGFLDIMAETEDEMAAEFLKQWLVYKHLYEEYGGKVVKVQKNYIPVAAAQQFIADIKQADMFEIYDQDYKQVLDVKAAAYEQQNKLPTAPPDDVAAYFSSPIQQFR